MRKNRLLIVLFTGVAVLLSLASCTYDYFEDETNYQVFVPEVLNKTVSDCRVLVYNDAGTLVGARYATSPWDKDPRMEAGLFSFRLTPGEYKVYCYTNTDSLTFVDGQHLDASAIALGGILGNAVFCFQIMIPCAGFILPFFGVLSGIFVGCWAMALAEILNVFPIFIRRVKLVRYIKWFIIGIALGKGFGACIGFLQ